MLVAAVECENKLLWEELMTRFCKPFTLAAILAGFAMAGLAPPARADFDVEFIYGGATILVDVTTQTATASGGASLSGATITYNSAGKVTISNLTIDPKGSTDSNTAGFNISASISTSNSPGTPTVAQITTSGLSITNQSGAAGNSTLTVITGSTGFTQPLGQVALKGTASVSADGLNSSNAKFVMNSYINTNNAQFGTTFGAPAITLNPVAPGASASGNSYITVPNATAPYSIVEQEQYTLANGDDFFDGSTGTSVVTPAPAGLVLALTGLPCLGIGSWLRRRKLMIAC
jgi:hypothetical protein